MVVSLEIYTQAKTYKKRDPLRHWKNRWIQTPQRILMDPCLKQAILDYPLTACLQQVGVGLYQKNNQFLINFWMKMKSFHDYLWLSNSCSYDVNDVIGREDRFEFQNFCSPDRNYLKNFDKLYFSKGETISPTLLI